MHPQALEKRIYKYKNPAKVFFCPLCRTERALTLSAKLSPKNYLQIFLTSLCLGGLLYPLMQVRSFFVFFIVWAVFELVVRTKVKKEVPCPHCGFDATLYKRDVRIARHAVKDFWEQKNKSSEIRN